MLSEISTQETRRHGFGRSVQLQKLRLISLFSDLDQRREEPRALPHDHPERDRRRHHRRGLDRALRLRSAGCDASATAWIGDLSKGGMFVRTPRPFPRGTMVAGAFHTAKGIVGFRGRVVRVVDESAAAAAGFGLEFTRVGTHALPTQG